MKTSNWVSVNPRNLQEAITDILREYGDVVYQATEEGLAAAEKVLIAELESASPMKTGKFKRSWAGTGKKYKLARFVGNTKTVKGKSGDIPLINIFEYSTGKKRRPFVKQTFENSIEKMASAAVAEIRKEV